MWVIFNLFLKIIFLSHNISCEENSLQSRVFSLFNLAQGRYNTNKRSLFATCVLHVYDFLSESRDQALIIWSTTNHLYVYAVMCRYILLNYNLNTLKCEKPNRTITHLYYITTLPTLNPFKLKKNLHWQKNDKVMRYLFIWISHFLPCCLGPPLKISQ